MAERIREPLGFYDRLQLAHDALVLRYEQRDNFLSDDDVLGAADDWTLDAPYGDDEAAADRARDDYEALRDALFARLLIEGEA